MLLFTLVFACTQQVKEDGPTVDVHTDTQTQGTDTSTNEDSSVPSEPESSSEPTNEPGDTEDTSPGQDILAIIGNYYDNYSSEHLISETTWQIDFDTEVYIYDITSFDNQARYVIAENSDSNGGEEVGKWSRFDWTVTTDNVLWFCQTTATANSPQDALNTPRPSESDLSMSGCPGYGWLYLTAF